MPEPRGGRRAAFAAALFFALLPAVLLGGTLVNGGSLLPARLLATLSPWKSAAPEDVRPRNPLLSDQVLQFYPWAAYARERVRAGELPLWNPRARCGTPFLANAQTGVFAPTDVGRYVLPLPDAPLARAWLQLFLAGFGAFLVARFHRLRPLAAVLAGLLFALSSYMVVWLGHPHTRVAAWLPWVFLAGGAVVRRPTPVRAVLLGLVLAAQFFGGHPETSFHLVALWIPYVAALLVATRFATDRPPLGPRLAALVGGAGLAVFLSGLQLVPFLEYLGESDALARRATEQVAGPMPWAALLTALVPDFFGNPARGHYWAEWGNFNECTLYAGIPALLLLPLGPLLGKRRLVSAGFLALAFLAFAFVFPVPAVHRVLNRLPGFALAANNRLYLFVGFGLALAAAFGAQAAARGNRSGSLPGTPVTRRARAAFWAVGGLGIALAGAALLGLTAFVVESRGTVALAGRPGPEDLGLLTDGFLRFFLLLGTAGILILGRLAGLLPARAFLLLVLGLAGADLWMFGRGYNPHVPRHWAFPALSATEWLSAHSNEGRIVADGSTLPAETATLYQLSDVRGFDAMTPAWMARLQREVGLEPPSDVLGAITGTRVPDLLSARFVLAPGPVGRGRVHWIAAGESLEFRSDAPGGGRIHDVLVETTLPDTDPPEGRLVAELEFESVTGRHHVLAIRAGIETAGWRARTGPHGPHVCRTWTLPEVTDDPEPVNVYVARLTMEGDERWRVLRVRAIGPGRLVLNAVRTRPDRFAAVLDDLTPVAQLGTVIHENPRALPRAFLAGGLERTPTESLHARLQDPAFEPTTAVLVDELPPDLRAVPASGPVDGEVELVESRPERVLVSVRADRDAYLVLTDTWFPGWRARVNDREVPILCAYGVVRAVPVPAGSSRVTFEYAPRSFAVGATASLVGGLAAIALLLLPGLRALVSRRRRDRP